MQTLLLVAQSRNVYFGEPDRQVGRLIVVAPAEDLPVPINPPQSLAVGQRDIQPHGTNIAFEPAIDQCQEILAALSGDRRDCNPVRLS